MWQGEGQLSVVHRKTLSVRSDGGAVILSEEATTGFVARRFEYTARCVRQGYCSMDDRGSRVNTCGRPRLREEGGF